MDSLTLGSSCPLSTHLTVPPGHYPQLSQLDSKSIPSSSAQGNPRSTARVAKYQEFLLQWPLIFNQQPSSFTTDKSIITYNIGPLGRRCYRLDNCSLRINLPKIFPLITLGLRGRFLIIMCRTVIRPITISPSIRGSTVKMNISSSSKIQYLIPV